MSVLKHGFVKTPTIDAQMACSPVHPEFVYRRKSVPSHNFLAKCNLEAIVSSPARQPGAAASETTKSRYVDNLRRNKLSSRGEGHCQWSAAIASKASADFIDGVPEIKTAADEDSALRLSQKLFRQRTQHHEDCVRSDVAASLLRNMDMLCSLQKGGGMDKFGRSFITELATALLVNSSTSCAKWGGNGPDGVALADVLGCDIVVQHGVSPKAMRPTIYTRDGITSCDSETYELMDRLKRRKAIIIVYDESAKHFLAVVDKGIWRKIRLSTDHPMSYSGVLSLVDFPTDLHFFGAPCPYNNGQQSLDDRALAPGVVYGCACFGTTTSTVNIVQNQNPVIAASDQLGVGVMHSCQSGQDCLVGSVVDEPMFAVWICPDDVLMSAHFDSTTAPPEAMDFLSTGSHRYLYELPDDHKRKEFRLYMKFKMDRPEHHGTLGRVNQADADNSATAEYRMSDFATEGGYRMVTVHSTGGYSGSEVPQELFIANAIHRVDEGMGLTPVDLSSVSLGEHFKASYDCQGHDSIDTEQPIPLFVVSASSDVTMTWPHTSPATWFPQYPPLDVQMFKSFRVVNRSDGVLYTEYKVGYPFHFRDHEVGDTDEKVLGPLYYILGCCIISVVDSGIRSAVLIVGRSESKPPYPNLAHTDGLSLVHVSHLFMDSIEVQTVTRHKRSLGIIMKKFRGWFGALPAMGDETPSGLPATLPETPSILAAHLGVHAPGYQLQVARGKLQLMTQARDTLKKARAQNVTASQKTKKASSSSLNRMTTSRDNLKLKHVASRMQLEEMKVSRDTVKTAKKATEADLLKMTKSRNKLALENDQLKADREDRKKSKEAETPKLVELSATVATIRNENTVLRTENAAFMDPVTGLQAQVDSKQAANDGKEREIANLGQKLMQSNEKCATLKTRLNQLYAGNKPAVGDTDLKTSFSTLQADMVTVLAAQKQDAIRYQASQRENQRLTLLQEQASASASSSSSSSLSSSSSSLSSSPSSSSSLSSSSSPLASSSATCVLCPQYQKRVVELENYSRGVEQAANKASSDHAHERELSSVQYAFMERAYTQSETFRHTTSVQNQQLMQNMGSAMGYVQQLQGNKQSNYPMLLPAPPVRSGFPMRQSVPTRPSASYGSMPSHTPALSPFPMHGFQAQSGASFPMNSLPGRAGGASISEVLPTPPTPFPPHGQAFQHGQTFP
jgi:hypothetical protein